MSIDDAKSYKDMGKIKFKEVFTANVREKEEQLQKELEKKKNQNKSSFLGNVCCIGFLALFLIFLVYSKLNEELWKIYHSRSSDFVDYYEVLHVDPNASSRQIKKAYRRLAVQYHPDRIANTKDVDAKAAEEKFLKITDAYHVLSNPEKREIYDSSNGLSSVGHYIRSKTITLTTKNYNRLVTESNDFWVIQVFSHDSPRCESLSTDWERLAKTYSFLKFGRVDFKS